MDSNLLEMGHRTALRCFLGSVALVLIIVSVLPASAEILFWPARLDFILPAGAGPKSVAIEDLNGDQVPDLAVANAGSDDVAVLLGLGDGSFAEASFYDAGNGPNSVAIQDLNGDQVPDLAVANADSDDVAVLLGLGDGSFAPATFYPAALTPSSVAIEDLNDDTVPDLAVACGGAFPGDVAILLGHGDGTFGDASFYEAGYGTVSVAIGDLNSDQVPDLAVANHDFFGVAVLLGLGDGTFGEASFYEAGDGPTSVAIADLNGDQVPDLAVANDLSDDVRVFLGLGDGTFAISRHYGAGDGPTSVAIEDLNGDQVPDLAVATGGFSGLVAVLLGLGDGTFAEASFYDAGHRPSSVAIADLNGDQVPDLVTSPEYVTSGVYVHLGLGDGSLAEASIYYAGYRSASVAIADLNGDQIPDLAVAGRNRTSAGYVAVLLGLGDGSFAHVSSYAAGYYAKSVAIADLNGDLVPDLAVAHFGVDCDYGPPGGAAILLGHGDGSFDEPSLFPTCRPYSVAIADLNGDRIPDLVTSEVAVLLGFGDGTFAEASFYGAGNGPGSAAIEDLNGDQVPDLAVASSISDDVAVLLGVGDGSFAAATFYGAGGGSVAIADLNGDQVPDLAVGGESVAVLLGRGDGSFAEATFYGAGDGSVAIEDLNGDQIPDLAVGGRSVAVLIGLGDGTFAIAPARYGTGSWSGSVAIADLNGDQTPDLVAVTSADFFNVAVLLGVENGPTPVELSSFEATPAGGDVTLRWTTGWESNVQGFHILRAMTSEITDATRVTRSLIPSGQHTYAFTDPSLSPGQYWYWLEEVTRSGALHHYGPQRVRVSPERPALSLAQNNPNPFHESTEIMFSVPTPTPVTVGVYDVAGRLIRSLLDQEVVGMGEHRLTWDGRGESGRRAASGIYFYRLTVGDQELERKLQLLR